MNKNRFLKALMLGFVMAIAIGFMAKGVTAQVALNQQIMMQSPICVPIPGFTAIDPGDDNYYADLAEIDAILVDNFEYWNNPRNMGWTPIEPAYPIWGAGLGYGLIQNVLDFEEGSKVLDVYRPTSVFLLDPRTGLATYRITKSTRWVHCDEDAVDDDDVDIDENDLVAPIWGEFCEFSCKIRHPLSVEAWNTFSIIISVKVLNIDTDANGDGNGDGYPDEPAAYTTEGDDEDAIPVNIVLRPVEYSYRHESLADTVEPQFSYSGNYDDDDGFVDPKETYQIDVCLGRQFQDGSWHLVTVNLEEIIKAADPRCTLLDKASKAYSNTAPHDPGERAGIQSVTISGNQYRVDDIMFTQACKSVTNNSVPHLFRIGPIYGQVWNMMQTFWIMAEDPDLGMGMFINENGEYEFANIFYAPLGDTDECETAERVAYDIACEEVLFYAMDDEDREDPNVVDPEDFTAAMYGYFRIISPAEEDVDNCDAWRFPCNDTCEVITDDDANLNFQFNVGDTLGSCAFLMARPIGVIPNFNEVSADELDHDNDLYPYLQSQVNMFPPYLLQEDGVIIPNLPAPQDEDDPFYDEDGIYLNSVANPMVVLAAALNNAGHEVFPNVRALNPSFGQVPEDMIITCRVTDGMATDKETFPVSVVNFPVTNFPPMLNDLDDQVFYVNEAPSVEKGINVYQVMATDHDLQDMFSLTYNCTLNGLPNYQVGPFQQRIIHPTSGLIAFTPYSEGALHAVITVEDPRGMWSVGEITVFCCNRGTWFNHPPIILGDLDSPQTIRAGQTFVANEMEFVDPDGDELYWSCNIGAVGANGLYTFQSQYPGYYLVQITAYDIRGGAATTEFLIHVLPWWSY